MGLRITNNYAGFDKFQESGAVSGDNSESQTVSISHNTKLPRVSDAVDFTALGCDTELKLAQAAYMAAAAKAGIADGNARRTFAEMMLAGKPPQLILTDKKIELDDAKVKSRLLNQSVRFILSPNEKAALEKFRAQYVAGGGAIRFNKTPTIDLRQAQTANGVNLLPISSLNTSFRVLLNAEGNPTDKTRVLAQFAEDRHKGGNLWGQNYKQIAELSIGQSVAPKVTKVLRVGNKYSVEFELTRLDQAKINENYKIVQEQVNEIEKLVEKINRDNPVSQFILGAAGGIKDNLVGTATMVSHPLETLQTIREAVAALSSLTAEDVQKIAELVKDKIKTTFTTKDGINSIPYSAGYVVGTVATDVVVGKGAGLALEGLKEIKPLANLLTKLEELKSLSKVKIAEAFSDEAASAAAIRLRQRLQSATLYAGIPADALADLAVVSANKVKNGAIKFNEFSRQMVVEFGDKIKPHLEKLYRDGIISLDLSKGRQILSSSGKVVDEAVVKEAKEKVFDLVKQNKSVELENYLSKEIRESYGKEFEKELRKTADGYVDGLYETARRTVDTHDLLGGHIREQHIGRSETWLRNRLKNDLDIEDFASSFSNEAIANRALGKFVKENSLEIDKWLNSSSKTPLKATFDFGEPAGIVVQRGKAGFKETNNVFVMLVKDTSTKGWHFETAFPKL